MVLSTAQLQALKTDIAANTATINGVQIKDLPSSVQANQDISDWYNGTASPDFIVWRDLPMETVLDLIEFAKMTPSDAVPTTPDLSVQVWNARAMSCQSKQFNLQNLTIGRSTATMKRANYRAGMQDCLTNIPAGASGATIAANWVGVRDAAKGKANRIEKLLATGTGTTNSPADVTYEGTVSRDEIEAARNLP